MSCEKYFSIAVFLIFFRNIYIYLYFLSISFKLRKRVGTSFIIAVSPLTVGYISLLCVPAMFKGLFLQFYFSSTCDVFQLCPEISFLFVREILLTFPLFFFFVAYHDSTK